MGIYEREQQLSQEDEICAPLTAMFVYIRGVELIFIPTCFRILVINIQGAVNAPCGPKALGNFHISKKKPRNSFQKIILSPCPCGLCPYNCPPPLHSFKYNNEFGEEFLYLFLRGVHLVARKKYKF